MELLKAALSSLPVAASSPYAFVGYLAVLIAWMIVAWRVKRNNQLLRHLKNLPAKNRLEALQMEMGTVRVQGGLTPEQWLKARTQFYYLIGFLAICFLILVLFSLSIVAARKDGDVAVDITVFEKERGNSASFGSMDSESDEVRYIYERRDKILVVEPILRNAAFLSTNLPIVRDDKLRKESFPVLSIQVVNNSNQTTLLTEAVLRVNSSKVNKEPILSVWERVGKFELYNQGWGNVIKPSVTFGIAEQGFCGDANSWKEESNSLEFGTFDYSREVSVTDFVSPDLNKERAVCVFGHLSYDTENGDKRTRPFKVIVDLPRPRMFDEYGDLNVVTHAYDVFLKAGRFGYSERVALSQKVEPGRTDHVLLKIGADKSGDYDLNLTLVTADGAVAANQNIDLRVLIPRLPLAIPAQSP